MRGLVVCIPDSLAPYLVFIKPHVDTEHRILTRSAAAGEQQQHGPATKPVDDVVFMLQKRIQIMQSIIDQLRASIKERQHWEEDAKTARQELERARRRIGGLEDERGRRGCAGEPTHDDGEQQRDAEAQEKNENSDTVTKDVESPREPGHGCTSLGEPLTTSPPETQEPRNDTIRLHHVVWGSSPVLDERLYKKLSQHATAGSPFTATRDFIGRDVEPGGRRTLVLAYSRPPGAPARWLVVDEGQEGRFGP